MTSGRKIEKSAKSAAAVSNDAFAGATASRGASREESPAPNETQANFAYRLIEEMIVTLKLPPGTRVSEKSLSAELGIGRTPVREALKRLAQERTITIHPRSGAVISAIDVDDHFKLIEVRRELERILVGRTARLADPGICKAFSELQLRFEKAAAESSEALFIAADREFNTLVASSADNIYAADAMGPLQAQTRRFWFLNFQQFGDLTKVCRLHAAIAKAIAANDERAARKALDRLIDYVEEYTYQTRRAIMKRS